MSKADTLLREVRRIAASARPDDDSDRVLLARFTASRDEQAFAELVRRHGPMVLGVCHRVLRHVADADDAFQAAFLILVRRAADVRDPDRLGPWLFGVAWRTANKLRATRRSACPLPDDVPNRQTAASDWPAELDAAIAGLSDKYRHPVVLCHLQGLTLAEAARKLGCPAATVATRLFRARTTLRRRLTALGLSVPVALATGTTLHLPAGLAAATQDMAAGRSFSPAAARLADCVFRSLLMTKVRWAATATAICLTTVGVLCFRAGGQEPPAKPLVTSTVPPVTAAAPPPTAGEAPATVQTANFRVSAPSARIARLIADAAERARRDTAVTWLGREQPTRSEWCRINVSLGQGSVGATTFDFEAGRVKAEMHTEGTLDRLLADVIPHEVAHVVMADHFRKPLPRWADEGIALLNESDEERTRHVQLAAEVANEGHLIQVKVLVVSPDYPAGDVTGFFAESYLLTRVLVDRTDRPTFLNFIASGMKGDWEAAARKFYGASLDDLEREMLDKLRAERKARGTPAADPVKTAPVFAAATADATGTITIFQPTYTYEPVTTMVQREAPAAGNPIQRVYYEPVTSYWLRVGAVNPRPYPRGLLRAVDVRGKSIPQADLVAALKDKTRPVLLVADGDRLDPVYADLLKPETLVLIIPVMKAAPAPPPTARPGM